MDSRREADRLSKAYAEYYLHPKRREKWATENPGNRLLVRERQRVIMASLTRLGLDPPRQVRVVEVGCGSGVELARLAESGWDPRCLTGIELVMDRVIAARIAHPGIEFVCGDASRLPIKSNSVSLVLAFVFFSTVIDMQARSQVAAEIDRILRPTGSVLVYDMRVSDPRNPHVRAIRKRELRSLFPGYEPRLRAVSVAPPVARRLGRLASALYPVLSAVPFVRTHYVGTLRKPSAEGSLSQHGYAGNSPAPDVNR